MGKQISLATLMDDVRFEFDLAAASSRVSDAQLTRLINRARDELFLYLLDCNSSFMDATTTLTTQNGIGSVSLPDRFYALTSLRLAAGDDKFPPLRKAGPDEVQYDPSTARAWGDGEALPLYWVTQNVVYFWPIPAGVYTLHMAYVQGFSDLSTGQQWNCMPGWDAWVVQKCLMRLFRRSKQMEAFQAAAAELGELGRQIESALSGVDRFTPPMVRRRSHFAERGPRISTDLYYAADGEEY